MSSVPEKPRPTTGVSIECDIRWGDLDAVGHVNNIIFFQFCESARIAYFDAIGVDRFKLKPTDGPGMVAANLNFRRQLKYPGRIRATAHATQVGERSYTLAYTIVDLADEQVVADGSSVCLWVDYAEGKAHRLPDEFVEAIAQIEGQPELTKRAKTASPPAG